MCKFLRVVSFSVYIKLDHLLQGISLIHYPSLQPCGVFGLDTYIPWTSWRVRGKTIGSVLCNIVCNNCAQCDAHRYEQTKTLDWVLSHWAHFIVLRFIFVLCITVCCMHA